MKSLILVDSDIFIDAGRGLEDAVNYLYEKNRPSSFAFSVVTQMELMVGCQSRVELRKLANAATERFRLDDELWAQIVYDFAVGYRMRTFPRDHLLRSLTPLYTGWLASIILQMRDLPPEVAEARLERLAVAFEAQKPYLMSRWRWPERFRT